MANETKVYVGKNGAKTLYKRLKDLIGRITTYQKVTNTTESGVPIVVNPNSRTIYLVKDNTVVGDDKYKEWIWTSDLGWECIGTTSIPENAWKQWAEDNGSVGTTDTVYLGKNNNLARTWSFGFGNNNTSSSTLDNVDWSGSDVVMIGSFNSAIDAAGAYQVGFRNSVVNNHRMSEASPDYNYYTAINFGNGNEIDAEGMNLGKDNTAADFGMNIGQHNTANHASLSIGERVSTNQASISIGTDSIAENKSLSIGFGSVAAGVLYNNGEFLHSGEYGSSIAIGINHLCAAKNSIAIGSGVTTADTYSIVSGGSFAILAEGIQLAQQASNINGNSFGVGSCLTLTSSSFSIGRFNTADNYSYAIGERNTVNCGSFAIGQNNTLIGDPNGTHYAYGYAFASGRDLNDVRGRSCTFGIGNNHITQFAYAAGLGNNSIHESAVAVGIENTDVYYHSTAVGAHNNNIHGDGVAIGNGNRDIRDMGTAVGSYNYEVYGGSFAAGEANAAQNGSIAIGISNKARCGGMLFGIGNYAIAYPTDSYYISYHANSVVMGFGNEVYNVREGLHKSGWTKSITTCGIAIGAYIKAYGHNFISFGSSNTLGDGANWMNDTAANTDNDGFMTAIGFQCTAKRNYDFAYGYQSTASGGENIAFQHSTATGYRNIAMVDSTLTDCTANIALCESSLTLNNVYSPKTNVIHNTLLHSKITATLGGTSNNMFMHTNGSIATSSANGIHRNTIMVGTEYHPVSITSDELSNNIIYGFRRGYFLAPSFTDNSGPVAISTGGSFDRNIMLNNAYGACTSSIAMNDNIIHSSELNVSGVSYFSDNIIASSLVNITRAVNVVNNVMVGRSKIDIQAAASEANNNFLMYSYLGDNNNGSAISTGEYSSQASTGYMTQNFLFGSNAYNVQATVSFATPHYSQAPERAYYDGYYKGEYPNSSQLIDCANVFNFGDNLIKGVNRAAVFGMAHNIHSSMNAFVYGTHNELSYTDGSIVMGERNYVLGMKQSYHDDVTHTIILGSNNNVKATNQADYNMIFGANNNIKGDFTVVTKTSAQIASLPSNVKEYIKASADCIYPTSSTVNYIYKNYYYFYSNGCLLTNYSTKPTGVSTIVDVSDVSTFVSLYSRRSLTEGTWYHVLNTGSSYRIDAPSGALVKSTKVYYHYNSTLVELGNYSGSTGDIAIYNSFNRIFGNANNLYDHVMNYTLVGEGNSVKCTDYSTPYDYAISNGFVQGNSNIALNGSNIICMGNGNQSTGHNSVAIGSQLISNQWQTVLGKYNAAIAGPNRLASETPQDPTKALLIVGNGYSTKDDSSWQDESFITRSNALELYADGRLKISGKIEASNIPPAPVADGQYALACEVVSGVATYRWVAVGSN